MTDHRQRLTTEDFAERTPGDRGFADRDAVDQTPADRDVAEPNLTDQERLDREPSTYEHVYDTPQSDSQHGDAQHAGVQQVNRSDTDEPAAWDDRSVAQPHDETVAQDPQDRAGHDQGGQDRDEQVGLRPDEPVELSGTSVTPGDAPLFTEDDAADYQANWRALQADFVDDPREAVQRADELVAQVMQSLATTFAEHKHSLEEQWQQGDEVQTEELRQALKRYRSFFDRLLRV